MINATVDNNPPSHMALIAAHIKFALDIRSHISVSEMGEYCAGAAYPDSRYVTGVNRDLTHFADSPKNPFDEELADFQRGWAAHNYYDQLGHEHYYRLMPAEIGAVIFLSPAWIYLTAIKLVEDLVVYDRCDAADLERLRQIDSAQQPCGEDAAKLASYYAWLRQLYASRPTFANYRELFVVWGIPLDIGKKIEEIAGDIWSNRQLRDEIAAIMPTVLRGLDEK